MVAAAGELLLQCGADVARVEDTITRIAQAYGLEQVDIYATPTGFFLSLGPGATLVKRVTARTMALDRVAALNDLSRRLSAERLEPSEALHEIEQLAAQPPPLPAWTSSPFSALAAASCAMLVGGSLLDFGPALLSNIVVQGVHRLCRYSDLPDALADFAAGAAAVFTALLMAAAVGSAVQPVVAGGIMVLVPGVAFTAAVRDAMAGDLVSAGARGLEALLKAAALAAGVASALHMAGGLNL